MAFADNAANWQSFENRFIEHYSTTNHPPLQLDIFSGASPEGTAAHNRWLGEQRGMAVRRLIRQRLGRQIAHIVIHNEEARWEGLHDLVEASNEPWRDEVLHIIEMPPSDDEHQWDHRELKLRSLHNGEVWPVLLRKYLAPLRSGATAVVSWRQQPSTNAWGSVGDGGHGSRDTLVVYSDCCEEIKKKREPRPADQTPAWAVKTNLLMWGVVAPNVEVEVPLGNNNRWSLEAEYFHPWFVWNSNAHASEFLNVGLELRYWLGHRQYHRWLDGWHVGLAAAAGYYDWEWQRHDGYQGEYVNGYFNIGYQHRWGRHWAIDAGIGLGVVASKYRHYYGSSTWPEHHLEEYDRHLMWHDTDRFFLPCATHVNISLVYLFNNRPFHFKTKKP